MAQFTYNAQNDAEYKRILAGYKAQEMALTARASDTNAGYGRMIQDNEAFGQSQRMDLGDFWNKQREQTSSSLASRGLYNTSVLDSAQQGNALAQNRAGFALEDSILGRKTDLQNQQLQFQAGAAGQIAGLQGQALDFQGQALGQRYGAEANYVSQYDLAAQGAKLGYTNQSNLQAQQNQYAMQTMLQQQAHQESMQRKFGYYS